MHYNLRSQNDFIPLPRRTSLFEQSFVPIATQIWNSLSQTLRNIQSLSMFKRELLNNIFSTSTVPPHFLHGNRSLSITCIHARLRNNCSDLKDDLFNNHVSDHKLCLFCNVPENADHYFFQCKYYGNERIQLFHETRLFHPLNCKLLLFGNDNLSLQQNITLVEAVQRYIKNTRRFRY